MQQFSTLTMIKSITNQLNKYFKEPQPAPYEPDETGYDPRAGEKIVDFYFEAQRFYERKSIFYLIIGLVLTSLPLLFLIATSSVFFPQPKISNPVIINFNK